MERNSGWSCASFDDDCDTQVVIEHASNTKYLVKFYDIACEPIYDDPDDENDPAEWNYNVAITPYEEFLIWIDPEKMELFERNADNLIGQMRASAFLEQIVVKYGSINHSGPSMYMKEGGLSYYSWGVETRKCFCQRYGRKNHFLMEN